jgi:hypothetical protein
MALLKRTTAFFMFCIGVSAVLFAQTSYEYELKAAFLYRFTEFVDWPSTAFANSQTPVRICVLGTDPFGDILDRTLNGERVNGRSVIPERIQRADQAADCHVLFMGRSEARQASDIMKQLPRVPLLIVGEMNNFLEMGGTVNFINEGGRIRFDINMNGAQRAQIQMSSKLLRLARRVVTGSGE